LAIAGLIVPNGTASQYALQSARDGQKVAALSDPRGLVRVNEWVILQAESTGTTIQGLPLLEVVDVLPEHWKQPSIWDHYAKGFGAWSGYGNTSRAEDYAGVPLEERRAYYVDNGVPTNPVFFGSWSGPGPSHPPVILRASLIRGALQLTWNTQSGARYNLLGSRTVDSGYTVISNVTGAAASASVTLPTTGQQQFFKILY
jgi:hypothetical protein